jgi:ABC-type transporter MlaC component
MIVRRLAVAAAGAGLLALVAVVPWSRLFGRRDPRRFLDDAGRRLRAAGSPRLGEAERRIALRRWIEETIDLEAAAAEVVGPAWTETPEPRRREAQDVLAGFLADRYAFAAPRIASASLDLVAIDEDWPVGLRAHVRAATAGRLPVAIEVRLRETPRGWRISDVLIDGVSLLRQTVREIGAPRPVV